MSKNKPTIDLGYPTPAHGRIPSFANIEEEAEFWDTHDTGDFDEEFQVVEVTVNPGFAQQLHVELKARDIDALSRLARGKGIGPATLARMWIEEHLREEDKSAKTA